MAPETLGFGEVTVSDTRSEANDTGGALVREMVVAAGHRFEEAVLVRDEMGAIRQAVRGMLSKDAIDVVVLTGGTGFSGRDVTAEAVEPLFERTVPGFGELFRFLSYGEIGAAAMLSRATAGVVAQRLVFALPGSPKGVALAMEKLILPEAAHLLGQVRKD